MQTSDKRADGARDEVLLGRILIRGTAIGFPLIFIPYLLVASIGGAHGAGAVFVAAWGALIGGTFVGAGIVLAPKMAELDETGRVEQPAPSTPAHDGPARGTEGGRAIGRRDRVRPATG